MTGWKRVSLVALLAGAAIATFPTTGLTDTSTDQGSSASLPIGGSHGDAANTIQIPCFLYAGRTVTGIIRYTW